jgi:hypothetical protein
MRRTLGLAAGIMATALLFVGCNETAQSPVAPVYTAVNDSSTPVVPQPKDTMEVVESLRLPTVDTVILTFTSLTGGSAVRTWTLPWKDSVQVGIDTGTGRLWRLDVVGHKGGRLWWTMDSIRVLPDSTRRIVLDSSLSHFVLADTTAAVATDTDLYIQASALSGDAFPSAGNERGVFLMYDGTDFTARVVSDGNSPTDLNDVFDAQLSIAVLGSSDSVLVPQLSQTLVNGVDDNDSTSTLVYATSPNGYVDSLYGNVFANFRLKGLILQAARCTLDVSVKLRNGVPPVATPGWTMPAVASDSVDGFIFLGSGRTHPAKSHFRIILP